ncbi:hypothetical protein [Aeromicrobium sp.]|uniref:hypothetical protein n=1 Tax=Aeromicrobium sp. TaxID=1871063 RepID=UPI0025C549C6|nr:hypothetical protein [Aeromicrobium sp.]MCK5891612.1 hypothetical protein [Aeromicrobium sp.]
MNDRVRLLLAASLPPLAIAAVGMTHPARLTFEAAHHWQVMHTVLLPVFPLLALGPWLVARRANRAAGVVAGVLAFVYACFYTSLDVIAGIATGAVKHDGGVGLGTLFRVAGDLGDIGSYAYFAASAVAVAVAARQLGILRAAPGAVLVTVGAVMFWQEHVYRPWGVLAMVLLAAGWGWLALARPQHAAQAVATS